MNPSTGTRVLIVVLCVLALTPVLLAQSGRGTITGTVTDKSGGVIPGVDVTATNTETGVETKTVTTDVGLYRIPYIQPGKYRVAASMTGFKTTVQENIQVLTTQTVTLDFALEVGALDEQITVSSDTVSLEKDTSEIGTAATELEVHTWPIMVGDGTRQLQNFIFSSMPGIQGDTWNGSINGGQSFAHEILIDGISIGRMDLNGGSNNEFTPTVDAVSEFKLQTGATSAQYGNSQTGLTNFAMKSGTNEYHGTAFWFHQNEALNANSWANNAAGVGKRPSRLHNFGTTFGGPILKDKTFFFFSYEGNRQTTYNLSGGFEALPVAPFKNGDFSLLLDPNFTKDPNSGKTVGIDALGRPVVYGAIYDPATSRQLPDGTWVRDAFPGNIVPANKINQISQKMLSYGLPEPARFQLRQNNPTVSGCCPVLNIDNYSFKLDHTINEAHKTYGTFVYNDRYRLRYGYGGAGLQLPEPRIPGSPLSGDKTQSTPGYIVRFAEDWTISPTKLNHFSIGYNRFRNQNVSNSFLDGRDWAAELGLQNVGGRSFPQLNFGGNNNTLSGQYQILGHTGTNDAPNGSTILSDDFTWIRGSHSFRIGGEHRRYYINDRNVDTPGSYSFHNENTALPGEYTVVDPVTGQPTAEKAYAPNATGFAFSSFLVGEVRNASVGINRLTSGVRSRTTAFYFQDDWKVNPNLTLNLGLRWDIPQPYTEVAGRMSVLDPNLPNPGADGYRGALAFLSGDDKGFGEIYWKQFSPRLGFAWAASQKIVLRGGYGINYAPPLLDGWNYGGWFTGFNGSNDINVNDPARSQFTEDAPYSFSEPYPAYTATLPNFDPAQLNGSSIQTYPEETNRFPMTQNWNFGIQYQLPWETRLEANYVGSHGSRLNDVYLYSQNQVNPANLSLGNALVEDISLHPEIPKPYPSFQGTVAQALRPFPQYTGVWSHRLASGFSNYNSLQMTLTKRATSGLSFLTAYTFSKAMATADNAIGYGSNYGYGGVGQDFYNRRADYSVTTFHVPHDLKITWIWEMPIGPNGRWLREGWLGKIVGGWTMSAIHRYRSGAPIAVFTGGYSGEALFNPGFRPDVVLPEDQQKLGGMPNEIDYEGGTPYLNPAAFAPLPKTSLNVPVRLGNAPRFLPNIRGFHRFGEDFSLMKRFGLPVREGANFEVRIDVINLFNRIGIAHPETDINDPERFGRVFSKAGGPRTIQGGLRVSF